METVTISVEEYEALNEATREADAFVTRVIRGEAALTRQALEVARFLNRVKFVKRSQKAGT